MKNVLILVPLLFSRKMQQPDVLRSCIVAFVLFCLVASTVYVINDIRDVERDRQHPTKCRRPIASGDVSVTSARILATGLIVAAITLALITGVTDGWWWLLIYLFLNLGYSMGLKEIPVLDIAILASGYVIRIIYSGLACHIEISAWLFLTVLAASFYFGLGKRRGELINQGKESRAVLVYYNRSFLDHNMYLFLALANVFYALWARSTHNMLFTVPFIMLLSMKYSLDIEQDSSGDPIEVILGDNALVVIALAYLACVTWLLYF